MTFLLLFHQLGGKMNNHQITEHLCLDNSFFNLVDIPPKFSQDDWLNAEDKELKYCALQWETRIRSTIQEPVTIKNSELLESFENSLIESTDKNTIPAQ